MPTPNRKPPRVPTAAHLRHMEKTRAQLNTAVPWKTARNWTLGATACMLLFALCAGGLGFEYLHLRQVLVSRPAPLAQFDLATLEAQWNAAFHNGVYLCV